MSKMGFGGVSGKGWGWCCGAGGAAAMSLVAAAAPATLADPPFTPRARLSVVSPPPTASAQRVRSRPRTGFENPLPGYAVTSAFGARRMPWEPRARLHAGMDIGAPLGTGIVAAADGFVLKSGWSPTYGQYVRLRHQDRVVSLYAHLGSRRTLRPGEFIARAELLGWVGDSGRSTGPHLHFELRLADGRPVNPALLIAGWPTDGSKRGASAATLTLASRSCPAGDTLVPCRSGGLSGGSRPLLIALSPGRLLIATQAPLQTERRDTGGTSRAQRSGVDLALTKGLTVRSVRTGAHCVLAPGEGGLAITRPGRCAGGSP